MTIRGAFIAAFAMLAVSLLFTLAGAAQGAAKTGNHFGLWVVGQNVVSEFQGAALLRSGVHRSSLAYGTDGILGSFTSIAFDRFNSAWFGHCGGTTVGAIVGLSAQQMRRLVHHHRVQIETVLTNPSPGAAFLSCPIALAFDGPGNLWAANFFDPNHSLVGFTPDQLARGESPPAYDFMAPEALGSSDLTFDHGGNLWVVSSLGVFEFRAGQLTGGGTLQSNLALPNFIGDLTLPSSAAFDSSGNLWVAYRLSANPGGAIAMYAAADLAGSNAVAPAPSVVLRSVQFGERVSIGDPLKIMFDPAGDLWVSNSTNAPVSAGNVTGFTPGQLQSSGSPIPSLGIFPNKSVKSLPSPFSLTIGPVFSAFK